MTDSEKLDLILSRLAIKVADKTLMYEVQMTSLKSRLELLEKEVSNLKAATA